MLGQSLQRIAARLALLPGQGMDHARRLEVERARAGGRDGQQHGTKRLADQEVQRAGGAFGLTAIQGCKKSEPAYDQVNHASRPISGPHEPFEGGIGVVGHQGPFCI